MRRAAIATTVVWVLNVAAAPAAAAEYPWDKRLASALDYARHRSGRIAFAVVDSDGRVAGHHIHETHNAASAVKAMLMVAYLRHESVRNRSLGRRDKSRLHPMITRSDNGAATAVRNIVGNAGLRKLAARVGMKDFATAPAWGSTRISAYDQARFFYEIDRLVPPRHRAYALAQLSGIIGPQRWGLPRVTPPGWRVYFKGGWRRERGLWLVNQIALLRHRSEERVSVAVLTDRNPRFRYGTETVRGVGARLLRRAGEFF